MDENTTDVTAGDVGQQQTGDQPTGDAAQTEELQQTGEQKAAAGQSEDEIRGLQQGIQAEREKRHQAESQLFQMQQYIAQMSRGQQQPQQDPLTQFMEQEGIGADGFLSADDLKKFYLFNQYQNQQAAQAAQQEQWFASHPDYVGVVTTPSGQISEHLLNAIKNDPALGMRLRQNWDPVLAYHAAKNAMVPSQPAKPPVTQITSGARPPQGISSATGSGGGGVDQSTMIQGMNDQEFKVWWQGKRR